MMDKSLQRIIATIVCCCIPVISFSSPAFAQNGPKRYALLIAGLGGTQEYTEKFHSYLYDARKTLIEKFQFPEEAIFVLADSRSEEENYINEISSAENITAYCSTLSGKVTENDDVYIILFGHGSYDGKNAMLNIPRKDLKDSDYAGLLDPINAYKIVFINTTSCSGPFIAHLTAPNRIIITATKSGTERTDTVFPRFLIEAMSSSVSDWDRNGDISVLEIYRYAAESTIRWYEESNHLATEHSLLEDTGDNSAYGIEELAKSGEGNFSGTTYLLEKSITLLSAVSSEGDSVLVKLFNEKKLVDRAISTLQTEKVNYPEQEYYEKLEPLLIRLSEINSEIESYEEKQ